MNGCKTLQCAFTSSARDIPVSLVVLAVYVGIPLTYDNVGGTGKAVVVPSLTPPIFPNELPPGALPY
jgi:hypothetical protein